MASYWTLSGFEDLYLEDSWVLSVEPAEQLLTLVVDFVLREAHPQYDVPRRGEQYCYRRGAIQFERVTALSWTDRRTAPPADAFGEQDLGSFDSFEVVGDLYTISGDFGRIEVAAHPPTVKLFD